MKKQSVLSFLRNLTEAVEKDAEELEEKVRKICKEADEEEVEVEEAEDEKELDENNPNEFADIIRYLKKEVNKGGIIHEALIEVICYSLDNLDDDSIDPMQRKYVEFMRKFVEDFYEELKDRIDDGELNYVESGDEEEKPTDESDDEEEVEEAEDDEEDIELDVEESEDEEEVEETSKKAKVPTKVKESVKRKKS